MTAGEMTTQRALIFWSSFRCLFVSFHSLSPPFDFPKSQPGMDGPMLLSSLCPKSQILHIAPRRWGTDSVVRAGSDKALFLFFCSAAQRSSTLACHMAPACNRAFSRIGCNLSVRHVDLLCACFFWAFVWGKGVGE